MLRKRPTWCFCRGGLATGRAAVHGKPVRFGAEFRVRETAANLALFFAVEVTHGPTELDHGREGSKYRAVRAHDHRRRRAAEEEAAQEAPWTIATRSGRFRAKGAREH